MTEPIITLSIIVIILLFHWVADFVVQPRSMAENKSSVIEVLSMHCLIYTLFLTSGLILSMIAVLSYFSLPITFNMNQLILFFSLIYLLHFITDYITSRLTKKYYMNGKIKKFWNTIGFDQWLHTSQIIVVYFLLFT